MNHKAAEMSDPQSPVTSRPPSNDDSSMQQHENLSNDHQSSEDSTDQLSINLANVQKTYRGRIRALDGVDIQVRKGEVFGLLGPNGAGKSTLIKIMMTVIRPSHAEGKVLGHRVGHKPTLKRIGYLPEHHRFPTYLTGSQVLSFYAALADVPRAIRKQRTSELLDRVGMSDWAKTNVSKYSKGMMQRVGLAQAMMNDPELILLDEPTDGVDPVGRKEIRDILMELKERGHTVFINSHLLSEVEMVCDRVAILVKGRTAMQGTLDELTRESKRIEIDYVGPMLDSLESFPGLRHDLGPGPHVHAAAGEPGTATSQQQIHRLIYPNATVEQAQPLIDRLRRNGAMIRRLQLKADSLEDLFIKAVSLDPRKDGARPGARRNHKP